MNSPETSADTESAAQETPPDPKERLRKTASDIFEIVEMFTVCAAVIMLLFTFIVHPTRVRGPSMEDTLIQNDYLLVSDVAYTPSRGDIVVVHNVGLRHYSDPIVKRIIATEGQTIDIDFETWTVTVDGKVVDEPYMKLASDGYVTSDWSYPIVVPEGHVFVMGDNRNHSADSRSREIGLIDERCIVGKAVVRVFPFSRFTVFE
ncbi:MAG: signal peptidase I [Clostridia bacterium]|nr:signal peptidase I [Clostridia bacterium]